MKLIINPPIEIDVDKDGIHCGMNCKIDTIVAVHAKCLTFSEHLSMDKNWLVRCQACLDAEKEVANDD